MKRFLKEDLPTIALCLLLALGVIANLIPAEAADPPSLLMGDDVSQFSINNMVISAWDGITLREVWMDTIQMEVGSLLVRVPAKYKKKTGYFGHAWIMYKSVDYFPDGIRAYVCEPYSADSMWIYALIGAARADVDTSWIYWTAQYCERPSSD